MKKLITILLISILSNSCVKEKTIKPSNTITKIEKVFTDFSSVETHGGIDLIITFNGSEKVEIETNQNIQDYILTTKIGNKLIFEKMENINFASNTIVKVYISAKKINEIIATGGTSVSCTNKFEIDNLNADFSGGANFTADLKCNNLKLANSGGSEILLSGTTDLFFLNSSGGSNFNGFNFITKTFNCDVSGGGEVNLTVVEKLDVKASGGSVINYRGNGKVNRQKLTGGSVLNNL